MGHGFGEFEVWLCNLNLYNFSFTDVSWTLVEFTTVKYVRPVIFNSLNDKYCIFTNKKK